VGETAEAIMGVATRLFAERGYEGTSVRAICEGADTNVNAISYHFGGKLALYTAVLDRMGGERLASAERILGRPPKDAADFEARLFLYAEESLAANLAAPELLIIAFNEWQQGFRHCDGKVTRETLMKENELLVGFLNSARRKRLLRKGVDPAIVAGALLERIHNQVRYADAIDSIFGTSVKDPKYLRHWTEQTIDLLLYGAARTPEE